MNDVVAQVWVYTYVPYASIYRKYMIYMWYIHVVYHENTTCKCMYLSICIESQKCKEWPWSTSFSYPRHIWAGGASSTSRPSHQQCPQYTAYFHSVTSILLPWQESEPCTTQLIVQPNKHLMCTSSIGQTELYKLKWINIPKYHTYPCKKAHPAHMINWLYNKRMHNTMKQILALYPISHTSSGSLSPRICVCSSTKSGSSQV